MSYRLMFIINAVVLALFGVAFMIMPESILAQFKSEVYVATLYVARIYGSGHAFGRFVALVFEGCSCKSTEEYRVYFACLFSRRICHEPAWHDLHWRIARKWMGIARDLRSFFPDVWLHIVPATQTSSHQNHVVRVARESRYYLPMANHTNSFI